MKMQLDIAVTIYMEVQIGHSWSGAGSLHMQKCAMHSTVENVLTRHIGLEQNWVGRYPKFF